MPTVQTLSGNSVAISYMTRDFESYRSDVLDSGGLADIYTPDWTDRSELDLGVALVEAFCFFADNLAFYQDRCVNEAFFNSAMQRRSVIQHCKLLSYELRPNTSAQVELTFVTSDVGTVPAGTQIKVDTSDGSDSATFELESDFVSSGAGTYTGNIAIHGITVSNEPLGTSDSSPSQRYELAQVPLTMNPSGGSSLQVWVDEGVPVQWTETVSFLESNATDEVFRIEIDEDDKVTVIFGDGVNGKIPAASAVITATYRIGGGYSGNQVGPNRLVKLGGSYSFVISVTNPSAPSGGIDKETIEEAKHNAPLTFRAMNRAVTHSDYAVLAKKVSGVLKSFAYQGTGAFEEIIVIAAGGENPIPTGSWDPYTKVGTGLIGAVGSYIEERKTTPVIIQVKSVNPVNIHLKVVVYCYSNARKSNVERLVKDEVSVAFSIEQQDFGRELPLSRVADVIEGISGVDYVNIDRLQRQPWARRLTGSASISFSSIVYGVDTPKDRWTIQFIDSSTFSVSGINSGLQVNFGTIGVAYLIDDESFGFTVSGSVTTKADRWEIVTGSYVGNISPDFDELCRLMNNTFEITVLGGAG